MRGSVDQWENHMTNERVRWPMRGPDELWSWVITLGKLIISWVKFLSLPLFVPGAMNTNFINLLNITNFSVPTLRPVRSYLALCHSYHLIILSSYHSQKIWGIMSLCRKHRKSANLFANSAKIGRGPNIRLYGFAYNGICNLEFYSHRINFCERQKYESCGKNVTFWQNNDFSAIYLLQIILKGELKENFSALFIAFR